MLMYCLVLNYIKLQVKKNDWEERCEVEKMIVEALQKYLTSLEQDYHNIVKQSDQTI